MRIAVVGAQNTGKTTLVNTFKAVWPMYTSPEKTYREIATENNLTLNEEGTIESQTALRDFLVDSALGNAGKTKTIHDRCVLDNLVYTLWLVEKGKLEGTDDAIDEFVATSINLVRESMKFYDIILWLPADPSIAITDDGTRSTCPVYREEIDNIFYGVFEHYKKNSGILFDKENQPAFIPLQGDTNEKIAIIKNYLNDDGDLIETSSSVLGDLEAVYDEAVIRQQIKN